jgi:antitoxin VapB
MTTTTVFTNNRTQAVRLPAEMRFGADVKQVSIRVNGAERIIAPIGGTWDTFFLDGPTASDDFMVERASQYQPERDSF